jgi:hypothetical protein
MMIKVVGSSVDGTARVENCGYKNIITPYFKLLKFPKRIEVVHDLASSRFLGARREGHRGARGNFFGYSILISMLDVSQEAQVQMKQDPVVSKVVYYSPYYSIFCSRQAC